MLRIDGILRESIDDFLFVGANFKKNKLVGNFFDNNLVPSILFNYLCSNCMAVCSQLEIRSPIELTDSIPRRAELGMSLMASPCEA